MGFDFEEVGKTNREGDKLLFDPTGVSVMLAMPVYQQMHSPTVMSLIATQDMIYKKRMKATIELTSGCSLIHHARNHIADSFLKSDHTHLFWIDADMVWRAEDFIRLLMFATRLDVVCAAYAMKSDPPQMMLGFGQETAVEASDETCGCIPIQGTGLGFTAMSRRVMEALAERAPRARLPLEDKVIPFIFRCDIYNNYGRGEDMAFFADITALGYKIWLDPNVSLGHLGIKEYRINPRDYFMPVA